MAVGRTFLGWVACGVLLAACAGPGEVSSSLTADRQAELDEICRMHAPAPPVFEGVRVEARAGEADDAGTSVELVLTNTTAAPVQVVYGRSSWNLQVCDGEGRTVWSRIGSGDVPADAQERTILPGRELVLFATWPRPSEPPAEPHRLIATISLEHPDGSVETVIAAAGT
jgi:hypothetical protein